MLCNIFNKKSPYRELVREFRFTLYVWSTLRNSGLQNMLVFSQWYRIMAVLSHFWDKNGCYFILSHVHSTSVYEKVLCSLKYLSRYFDGFTCFELSWILIFEMYICLYVCTCVRYVCAFLARERWDEYYSCSVNMTLSVTDWWPAKIDMHVQGALKFLQKKKIGFSWK
jgi:hypothetical protein